jgi:hypothetical protein
VQQLVQKRKLKNAHDDDEKLLGFDGRTWWIRWKRQKKNQTAAQLKQKEFAKMQLLNPSRKKVGRNYGPIWGDGWCETGRKTRKLPTAWGETTR